MLDIQAEAHDAGQYYPDLYEAVVELKRRHDLHPCAVRPRDMLSLRDNGEREEVQDLVVRFRRLPEETRRTLPALWNSLAQLEIVIGDLDAGLADFKEVAQLVRDPISIAEAHHNIYRAALERRDWDTALSALRRAVALDPQTFEPFPFTRFEPIRILGSGGIGLSVLCKDHTANEREVVVKALRADSLDREPYLLLTEARQMRDLGHPSLVTLLDSGFASTDGTRPYLVYEHLVGTPLDKIVAEHGPFSPEEWLEIAWPILRALQALHGRGLLHRALRPDTVLLRRVKNRDGASIWKVKLLEAGLALRRAIIHASACLPESAQHSSLGRTVARVIPYSPPEVISRPKGQVWVGPHSDLYSFGKLTAFALTGKPDPDSGDRLLLPEAWNQLLDRCTAWTINRRPSHVGLVTEQLAQTLNGDELLVRVERDMHQASLEALTERIESNPDDVEARMQRGQVLIKQAEFEQAIEEYTAALRQRPEAAVLYRLRGLAHVRTGQLDQAITDFTEALRLEPRQLEAIVNRALTYAQKGEYERAIADYTEGLRLSPRDEILYYNRGNARFARGEYAQAVADYSESLRLDSSNLWALGNRGRAYLLSGEPGRAVTDFTRLLQLDPNNVRARCDRASAYQELGRHSLAVADLTEALRLDPSPNLWHERGLAYALAGDLQRAVADFTTAVDLAPDNAGLLLSRGKAHHDLKQYDKALADLTAALQLAPQHTDILIERSEVFVRLNRYDEALADLTTALQISPSASLYFHRGNVHARQGNHEAALADFSQVLQLDPEASGAYTNRGNAHLQLGELDQALADFEQALRLDPNDELTHFNRASVHLRRGDLDAALADYSECLRLNPAHTFALSRRAHLLARQGKYEEALADLDAAIRLEPSNALTRNQRGALHADRGNRERAIADFSQAIRLDPNYASAWYNRGIAYLEEGRLDEAITDFTESLRLDPTSLGALLNRGLAHRNQKNYDLAIEDFSTAIELAPELAMAYYNRASVYLESGDLTSALNDLNYVLKQTPDDIDAWIFRARIHSQLGQDAEAVADNFTAWEHAPGDVRVANNLGWLLAVIAQKELRDPNRAIEFAQQAVAANPSATHLDTLAAALASAGRFAEAIETQRRAIELASEAEKPDFLDRLTLYEQGKPFVLPPRHPEPNE